MLTQGYIGVSSRSAEVRFLEHTSYARSGKTLTLSRAIRKHGNKIVIQTLLKGDMDYCLLIEARLRPSEQTGWNIVAGGGKPPVFKGHSEESKKKIGIGASGPVVSEAGLAAIAARRGVPRTVAAKAKMKIKAQGRLPWNTSRASKQTWAMADEIFSHHKRTGLGSINLERVFGLAEGALKNMINKFKKQNWNPICDPLWVEWVQNYKS